MKPTIILEHLPANLSAFSLTVERPETIFYILYGFADGEKEISLTLSAEGAHAYILGVLIGTNGTCSVRTLQRHTAPATTSDLHIKTILSQTARFQYRGIIQMEQRAQQANAYQRNDNLLLSEHASVDTRPELEIIANDVRCTHGATTGNIREEDLFYLQSRGIHRPDAEALITEGFAREIAEKIPDHKYQEELFQYLRTTLHTVSNAYEKSASL